jgi:hypothetical protein
MSGIFTRDVLTFLYRKDEGTLSRAAWWSGLVPLASLLAIMTVIWLLIAPWGQRGLDERAFLDPRTIVAYIYLLIYTLSVILIAVSYTNLSEKRFRARGRIGGLAGLLPLCALLSGAAHWLYPRVAEVMPYWTVLVTDGLLIAVIIWHILDLGLAGE